MNNFGFKTIEEFTFDDCFVRIEQNRVDGVESDSELLERYAFLLSKLQQKDDAMYREATDKTSLEKYLASYLLDATATKYRLRHINEAKEKIALLIEIDRRKKRKATIIVLSVIAVVAVIVCWLNYEPVKYINVDETVSVSKYGDSIRVTSQTNVPSSLFEIEIESGREWLQVLGEDGSYTFVAKPNPSGSRHAEIKISAPNRLFGYNISRDSKTINISQESGVPTYINPQRSSIFFDKYGKPTDKANLIISTDGVLESVASAPDWCNISFRPLSGERYLCVITMDKNNGARRYGEISLKGGGITQSISIQQESGLASYIGFNSGSISVSPREETEYVDVRTDGTSWTIISKPYWVEASDNGNNSLKLIISENETDQRSGTLTIKSNNGQTATLAINQGTPKASYIRAEQTSINAGISGLDKYITVSTDGKDWSVYSSPSWLTVTPYIKDQKIYVEIPSNRGYYVKEGEIILASNNGHQATISVKQDGNPTNFKAGQSKIQFDTGSDYEYVNIGNNSNQSLSVDESQSWITASATSKDRIRIAVSSNSNSPRSGYVTVRCGDESCRIEVRQRGWYNCGFCGGRGLVQCGYPALWMNGLHCVQGFVMNNYTGGGYYTYNPCPNCGGSGSVTCSHCKGDGRIKSN